MTRHGIEYDLPISPYKIEVGIFTLHFSSKTYEKKFTAQYNDFVENLNTEMENRFGVKIEGVDVLAVPYLYAKIEKRGFYVTADFWDDEDEYFLEFTSINQIVIAFDRGQVRKCSPQYSGIVKRA